MRLLLCVALIGLVQAALSVATEKATKDRKIVVCYYGSWAVYRPGRGKFDVEDIDPYVCTHLVYGFAGLNSWNNEIRALDPYNDVYEDYGKGAFERFVGLKKLNPELKILLAIGGWNEGSIKYSNMAMTQGTRKTFVDSCVKFLKRYGFEGLDLDWEYPGLRGGKPQDKQNFVHLMRELKEAFKPHNLMLTAAVSAGKETIDTAYDVPALDKYLDFISVMAYDYHGGWEMFTGHHSPLYQRPDESGLYLIFNTNYSINYWISLGAKPHNLVHGMGLYGRGWTLAKTQNHGLYADANQALIAGPYTREKGFWGYNEICEKFKTQQGWTVVRDPYYMAPYAYRDRNWIGYDDLESIKIKAQFAAAMGLKGGMVWSIETDDFKGFCNGKKFEMITMIHETMNGEIIKPTPPPPTTPIPGQSKETTIGTTTTPRPTIPTPEPSEVCSDEGFHSSGPCSANFYQCLIQNGQWVVYQWTCAEGTVFDNVSMGCTWPHMLPECTMPSKVYIPRSSPKYMKLLFGQTFRTNRH